MRDNANVILFTKNDELPDKSVSSNNLFLPAGKGKILKLNATSKCKMNESARSCKKKKKKSLSKKQQWWIEHEQLCNSKEKFKNKSSLPLVLHQWPSLGKRLWPLRKSKAHMREGEQSTIPRRSLQNNTLSISALLLAHSTIPAAHFPESQRDVAWCAPGHSVPITTRVGQGNDPYGFVNIELFTKGQHKLTMANGFSPCFPLCDPGAAMFQHWWSSTVIFPSG